MLSAADAFVPARGDGAALARILSEFTGIYSYVGLGVVLRLFREIRAGRRRRLIREEEAHTRWEIATTSSGSKYPSIRKVTHPHPPGAAENLAPHAAEVPPLYTPRVLPRY
ncbi:hypothetical protein H0H92_016128 [Tricholoma furcatifolium]|nr:hypothetical protein H0H92_016128 [Tricholoma furcatifolium]